MKVLFIGGTGNISTACSRLALARGVDLALLTRGRRRAQGLEGARRIDTDLDDASAVARALGDEVFDAVVQFIGYAPADVERDITLFAKRCRQYVFISSASVYQKPLAHPVVDESTPLGNPFWDYSRAKIACELRLQQAWRDTGFPAVIVRPSLTYDTVIPTAIGGWTDYGIIARMRRGAPVVVHGDGTSLWTVTHSDDFAQGLIGLLGHQQAAGHAFHITSDELLTWNQIYQAVAAAAGAQARLVHLSSDAIAAIEPWQRGNLHGDKAHSAIFDNAKIRRFVPAYRPAIRFADGIRRTLAWFEADAARRTIDPATDALLDRLVAAASEPRATGAAS